MNHRELLGIPPICMRRSIFSTSLARGGEHIKAELDVTIFLWLMSFELKNHRNEEGDRHGGERKQQQRPRVV
jgi:hypothetical protein